MISTGLWLAKMGAMPARVAAARARRGPAVPDWPFAMELAQRTIHASLAEMIKHPPQWGRRLQKGAAPPLPSWVHAAREPVPGQGPRDLYLEHKQRPGEGPVVFYVHGGGYVIGEPKTYGALMGELIREGGVAFAPGYPRVPEHSFASVLNSVDEAYRALAKRVDPRRLIIAGDSAGGALALSLCRRLASRGGPLPRGAYLLSPWVDPYWPVLHVVSSVDMLNADFVAWCRELAESTFVTPEQASEDPEFVPMRGIVADMPALRIDSGGAELFAPQIEAYVKAARKAGVEVDARRWPRMVHVFQLALGLVPEAREALTLARGWMWAQVGTPPK